MINLSKPRFLELFRQSGIPYVVITHHTEHYTHDAEHVRAGGTHTAGQKVSQRVTLTAGAKQRQPDTHTDNETHKQGRDQTAGKGKVQARP